ncbi:DUF6776 family protein [Lysobacter sp. D1-1-M9]|uniref:DUF6776 family protein n=1 Tax=Novilysobacter longmucuonensis TaxID=3098603 RepID=UPI002FCA97CD
MNDDARAPAPGPASATATPLSRRGRLTRWLVVLVAVALLFGVWGAWRVLAPATDDVRAQLAASERDRRGQSDRIEHLQQRVATLGRSDQISRDANRDLQSTLAERDEEIAALRADVAFYERLVGSTEQRRGLTAHAIRMQPQNGAAWHFTSTLTQNLNRGAISAGELTLSIEGTRDGRLQTLDWDALRQQEDAPGVEYSFKYFEQLEGDVFLPEGLTPVRVKVRLAPDSGAAVERSFGWAQVAGEGGSG